MIYASVFPLARPNLGNLALIVWTNKGGKQEIFCLQQSICDKWVTIGDLLHVPPSFIAVWKNKHPLDRIRNVLDYWLNSQGARDKMSYPVSWEGLYQLLEDAQLSEYAARLKKAIECIQCKC